MTRQRTVYSILLAVLIHAAVLLLVQMFVHFNSRKMPDYSGPLIVTLEETSPAPVLQRQQERQPPAQPQPRSEAQAQPAPATRRQEPAPQAEVQVPARTSPAQPQQPRVQSGPQTAPRTEPQPAPQPAARAEPDRSPQGTRQVVPAEPLGTLPPVAPEEDIPYQPQTFSQPLADEGPVRAAPSRPQEQSPRLDTSRLDSAIGKSDSGVPAPPAGSSGISTGPSGTASTSIGDFEIQWQDPRQGREVRARQDPSIPDWVSEQGLRLQVAVSFDLGSSGYLSNIRVSRSCGYPEVDSAVVAALRSWRFTASPGAPNVRGEVTYRIIPR
jgi:TonB family protein